MATHFSHCGLPFPVRNARFTVVLPFMDADGDPTDPTATLDTEISVDNGSFADAAEELSVVGSGAGWGIVTLTGAEMNNALIVGQVKNGAAKAAQFAVQPRTLPVMLSGTAQAGAAGTITLPSAASPIDDVYNGCIIKTTGGTGGGGTGGANNQARVIRDYVGSTRVATIEPDWETTPDNTTTVEVLATDLAAVTSTALASSILDELLTGHSTAGTAGKVLSDLDARLTAARAGYLDNLNVGGLVASSAEATAIQNNTRVVRVAPDVIERPDSGTTTYRVEILLYDETGNMEAPDSAPTIALVNQAGTDRSSRLDSTTMALVETGRYRAIYTASSGDTIEQLVWTFSVVEGGNTRKYGNQSLIVDTTAVDFTSADRSKLDTLHDTRLTSSRATALDSLDASISSRSSHSAADVWAVGTRTLSDGAGVKKNTALNNFPFKMVDAAGDPVLLATVTATRMIDGGSFAACANAPVEAASGWYRINLATTDLNGDIVTLRFTAPGAQTREITLFTEP